MYDLSKMVKAVRESGYDDADAQAKVCQDIVLKAISESDFSRSVTIKGGVVMRSLTKNIRWLDDDIGAVFTKILEFLEKNAESEY